MSTQRRYRIVPSERAGYGPGRYVVQYRDEVARVWFDSADPRDTREEARALLEEREAAHRETQTDTEVES